jgi:GNAT domain-containint protein/N-acyltransferase family protein
MKIEEILAQLQEPGALEALRPHWDESVATLGQGRPGFLDPEEFTISRQYCGFGAEVDPLLEETARRIARDPALRYLAWHCFRLLGEHGDYHSMGEWPALERALGEMSGVFYLLVAMGMVPRVRAVHKTMGVPDEVTRETCTQVSCFAGNFRRMTGGRLGVTRNTLPWLRHYIAGRLFRLGRMEYMIQPYRGGAEVYRNRETGAVIALAPEGVRYNREGYVETAGSLGGSEHGWTATLVRDDEAVTGYPISPLGMAVRQEVRLPRPAWECVLTAGDPTLDMHIPAGGGMTPERCGDSMRRAVAFFQRFSPGTTCRAITCSSWIFNTQFEQIRLSSDNLVRYQRELYLYPTRSNGRDGLWFIFLQDNLDLAALPRDTSLRRGVADFLLAGNTWRGGGMFFLTEHLAQFGTQYYRLRWPPPELGHGLR